MSNRIMNIEKFREQRSSIVLPNDKVVFDELLLACEHDLYRAAYILAWIAIVESLKGKIYVLADLGDKRALNEKSNIEDGEKNHNSTDKTIITGAIRCEIVPSRYESELNYLWEQRCLYAHPYQNTPNEADVQHIVEKALEITLSQELMYSRIRIDEVLDEEMNAFHLVPTIETEREEYIKRHLSLIKNSHYSALFKKLFFLARKSLENMQFSKLRYILKFIKLFVTEKSPQINDAAFRVHDGIVNYPNTMWYVVSILQVWEILAENFKDEMFRYLGTCGGNEVSHGLRCVKYLLEQNAGLKDSQKCIYYERLARLKISESWQYYVDQALLLMRIKNEWITDNWGDNAKFVNWLHDTNENIQIFDDNFVENVAVLLAECCNKNAFVAQTEVRKKELNWFRNDKFKIGLSLGFFKNKENFKFAYNFTIDAIEYLSMLNDVQMDEVASRLGVLTFTNDNPHKDIQVCLRAKVAILNDRWTDNLRNLLNERIDGCFRDEEHNN